MAKFPVKTEQQFISEGLNKYYVDYDAYCSSFEKNIREDSDALWESLGPDAIPQELWNNRESRQALEAEIADCIIEAYNGNDAAVRQLGLYMLRMALPYLESVHSGKHGHD